MSNKKLIIGIPHYNGIEPRCTASVKKLGQELSHRFDVKVLDAKGPCTAVVRNNLLAMAEEADLYLGLDADLEITLKNFNSMLDRKLSVVFGAYETKHGKEKALDAGWFLKGYPGVEDRFLPVDSKELQEVDWAGGCFLMEGDFYSAHRPLFHEPIVHKPDGKETAAPENFGFCMMLKEMGVKIQVDCDTRITHLIREDEEKVLESLGIYSCRLHKNCWASVISSIQKVMTWETAEPILKEISKQLRGKLNTGAGA